MSDKGCHCQAKDYTEQCFFTALLDPSTKIIETN